MYCSVHRPVNTPGVCDNKGSCFLLVEYLSKEDRDNKGYFDSFFSNRLDFVNAEKVLNSIDSNKRTLKKRDDKFYMLSLNPSKDELRHLILKVTGKDNISDFTALTLPEQESVIAELKNFARRCMDQYAANFYREKIKDADDLVWFGRVETERRYKGVDDAVKKGEAKSGELKPGLQLHVHIIVSRMDKSQTISLSPLANSKGTKQILDGREVVVGFNRSEWASRCADYFNEKYDYIPRQIEKETEEKYREWNRQVYLNHRLVRKMKREILHGQLNNELMYLSILFQTYRFVLNRVLAFNEREQYVIIDNNKGKSNEHSF